MLKLICSVTISTFIVFASEFIQAADEEGKDRGQNAGFYISQNPKASIYQIEGGGDYLFVTQADCIPFSYSATTGSLSRDIFDGKYIEGKESRLFKGPIDNLEEVFVCSTAVSSTGAFDILTRIGNLSMDKKQWEDKYENVFNLITIPKENNDALFRKMTFIALNQQEFKETQSEKLEKAGLPSTTDLAPKSRLYRVEEQDKYFFVGIEKATYYEDKSGNFKSSDRNSNCPIPREGYTARIFYGQYPQLIEVLSIDSFYPGQSSPLGPFHLIGIGSTIFDYSTLNPMKSQWISGDRTIYKIVHVKKADNEEFHKKIKLVYNKK